MSGFSDHGDQPRHRSEGAPPPDQPPDQPPVSPPYPSPPPAGYPPTQHGAHQAPLHGSPPPPSAAPRPRRRLWWLVAAGAAVALVVGLVVALWAGSSTRQRAAFDAAVAELAKAHAAHQKASLGFAAWDLQVTSTGESTGTMNLGGLSFQMLTVGGNSYIKAAGGLLPGGATTKLPATFLKGKWVKADSAMLGSTTSQVGTPSAMAGKLHDALKSATFPTSLHATDTVHGTPAIKATGKSGDVYVSASKPYHVLRFAPRLPEGQQLPSLPKLPSMPPLPSMSKLSPMPKLPPLPSLPTHRFVQLTAPSPAGLSMDISPEAAAQVVQTYKDIEGEVRQLKNVVDAGIDAHPDGPAQLACGAGGCDVSAEVDVNSRAGAKIEGELSMQATVTLNGEPAGQCSAPPVPLTGGTVQLSCEDPAAAAAYEAQTAQVEPGEEVALNWEASCEAYGEAKVDVARQVAQIEQELEEAEQEMQSAGGGGAPPPPPTTGAPPGAPSSEPSPEGGSEPTGATEPDPNNNGLGPLEPVNAKDPAADALAKRIGGVPSVKFANDPSGREFDAVSDRYIAQAKPANFTLNKKFRDQAKATFDDGKRTGRIPYFQFDGPPGPGVIDAIERYAERYGIRPVIDETPLQ